MKSETHWHRRNIAQLSTKAGTQKTGTQTNTSRFFISRFALIFLGILLCTLSLAILLTGCGTSATTTTTDHTSTSEVKDETSADFLASDVKRSPATADVTDLDILVTGNNTFGLELFRQVRSPGKNLVCSPYGLSAVLAMTWAGASGETEQEMAEVLHFDLPQAKLHVAFNSLDQELAKSGQLQIANALWGTDRYTFNQEFIDLLAREYGAGLAILDFNKQEEARETINDWAKAKTKGKIPELLGPGQPSVDTVLALANAVYFKADWARPFDANDTYDNIFHLPNGTEVEVPFMHKESDFDFVKNSEFQAIELPYIDNDFSMLLILPPKGTEAFEEFVTNLYYKLDNITYALLAAKVASKQKDLVELSMPQFEFSSTPAVQDALEAMGMDKMFKPLGDFSEMLDTSKETGLIFVDTVLQKAFISVGEEGTEAAAVSYVAATDSAAMLPPEEPEKIILDRPFIYLIKDNRTGQILFIGQVMDPSREE